MKKQRNELIRLVGGNAKSFVEGKKNKLKEDLTTVYKRLGGKQDVSQYALREVMNDVSARIQRALNKQLLARVTFSDVRFDLQEKASWQAPWAQAEKLMLALARFPRQVIHRPKTLSGLQTSQSEILIAMNIADDIILKMDQWEAEHRSRSELQILEWIENANIEGRDRCEAIFMLIDGKSHFEIHQFIARRESTQ